MASSLNYEQIATIAQRAARSKVQVIARTELAEFTAATFTQIGKGLSAVGSDPPCENASDEVVAVSLLFRIGGELTSASGGLFSDGRHYAGAALLRQIVEIEYLAWAFESRDKDAERWLKSDAEERRNFFTPAKLRQAANGKFRGKDYGFHCELGGHPVPGAFVLLRQDEVTCQLLLSDLLGHTGRIWDHLLDWSADKDCAAPIHRHKTEMFKRYNAWKRADELTILPPPP